MPEESITTGQHTRNEGLIGHRDSKSAYRVKYNEKGQATLVKIASHPVRIVAIQFVLTSRCTSVRYLVEFKTEGSTVNVKFCQEDLVDERSFLAAAPAGFSLAAAPRSFNHLRECLMKDLETARRGAVLTALGWYRWKGRPVFAHAGGIISSDQDLSGCKPDAGSGTPQALDLVDIDKACSEVPILAGKHKPIDTVHVEVIQQLRDYHPLPPSSRKDAQTAMTWTLELLKLGDPHVTYIAIASIFVGVLRNPRFAVFLQGETGSMKTAFALLILSFFVPDPQESHCASFKSTENALRARFSHTSNVPVIVDDYIELPGRVKVGEEAKKAENLVRSVVNGTGKDRSRGDGSLREAESPRGLAIITGEQLPTGLQSLRQRLISLPVDTKTFAKALDGPRPNRLDQFQAVAASGVFAQAMGGFIAWAAGQFELLREYLDDPQHELSEEGGIHRRQPDAARDILSGAALLLEYAKDLGVVSDDEYEQHARAARAAVDALLQRAVLESLEDSPTEAFAQLLQAAMSSCRCHIEIEDIAMYSCTEEAIPVELFGYTRHKVPIATKSQGDAMAPSEAGMETETTTIFRAHGPRIGWIANQHIDLIPDAALAEANSMASKAGASRIPPQKSFGKLLAAKQWIETHSKGRNTYKVRRETVVIDVWRIHAFRLFEIALPWGTFDVESYTAMTEAERLAQCRREQDEKMRLFRQKIARYQSQELLNGHLTEPDRQKLLRPAPPPVDGSLEKTQRLIPPPPAVGQFPGYGEPDGDGLLA